MGYSHYFSLSKDHKRSNVNQLKIKVWKVLYEHGDIIQYESDDDRLPICEVKDDEILIRFNGIGEDGHETFYFDSKDPNGDYCKTARKPYDLVVTKILVLLKEFYGNRFKLSSDGFYNNQPPARRYSVGDIAGDSFMDGNWGDVVREFNKENDTQFQFKVIGTHGDNNCYFKATLEKAKLVEA